MCCYEIQHYYAAMSLLLDYPTSLVNCHWNLSPFWLGNLFTKFTRVYKRRETLRYKHQIIIKYLKNLQENSESKGERVEIPWQSPMEIYYRDCIGDSVETL
jgi:hypothetical protein